jgi:hypothetical protein
MARRSTNSGHTSGDWVPIETLNIAAAVQTVDFATVLSDAKYSGYRINGVAYNGYAGSVNLAYRLNGATWVASYQYYAAANTTLGAGTNTNLGMNYMTCVQNGKIAVSLEIPESYATTISRGAFSRRQLNPVPGTTTTWAEGFFGLLITTPAATVEITSLGLVASQAAGIGIGSVLRLYGRLV